MINLITCVFDESILIKDTQELKVTVNWVTPTDDWIYRGTEEYTVKLPIGYDSELLKIEVNVE